MDWSRHLCGTLHCPFLWGPLYMCVLHCSEVKRGVSIAGLLAVETFTWPILTSILFFRGTGRNLTAGLVTTGCSAVRLRV